MSKPVENPTRLGRLPASEDSLGIGRMFRNARELPEEDLPTLRWQLRTSQRMRVVRPSIFLKLSLAIGVAFCVGGVVGASVWPFWPKKDPAAVTPAPTLSPEKPRKPHMTSSQAPALGPAPVAAEEPLVVEAPKAVPAPAKHRPRVAMTNEPPPVPPPPVPADPAPVAPLPATPSPIAVEQALLGQAVKVLRDGHDAQAALTLLAQHTQQFPHGALASEESMLRVEALLVLGRHQEALSVLDRTQLGSLPNREEQLVVRGELRAADRRWREARQDFDDALAGRNLPAASAKARNVQERALWGRASARSRLGDEDGARADLELYLKHFPGGRFATAATTSLKGKP